MQPTAPLTGEALQREQMRRTKRRNERFRLHFNSYRLTAKCRCECGLRFTTKGIAQHQHACPVYQAKWAKR